MLVTLFSMNKCLSFRKWNEYFNASLRYTEIRNQNECETRKRKKAHYQSRCELLINALKTITNLHLNETQIAIIDQRNQRCSRFFWIIFDRPNIERSQTMTTTTTSQMWKMSILRNIKSQTINNWINHNVRWNQIIIILLNAFYYLMFFQILLCVCVCVSCITNCMFVCISQRHHYQDYCFRTAFAFDMLWKCGDLFKHMKQTHMCISSLKTTTHCHRKKSHYVLCTATDG